LIFLVLPAMKIDSDNAGDIVIVLGHKAQNWRHDSAITASCY
jgi:hypothetical protein